MFSARSAELLLPAAPPFGSTTPGGDLHPAAHGKQTCALAFLCRHARRRGFHHGRTPLGTWVRDLYADCRAEEHVLLCALARQRETPWQAGRRHSRGQRKKFDEWLSARGLAWDRHWGTSVLGPDQSSHVRGSGSGGSSSLCLGPMGFCLP